MKIDERKFALEDKDMIKKLLKELEEKEIQLRISMDKSYFNLYELDKEAADIIRY